MGVDNPRDNGEPFKVIQFLRGRGIDILIDPDDFSILDRHIRDPGNVCRVINNKTIFQ